MKVHTLEVHNFKKFARQTFELHPRFTLLVGDNGSGKISVLDALAVALGIWLVEPPDSILTNSGRPIYDSEIRLEPVTRGDRTLFQEASTGVFVRASGRIEERDGLTWTRKINPGGRRTSNADAQEAIEIIRAAFQRARANEDVLLPVLAYYGAGRAWLPHHERGKARAKSNEIARRWGAFYDCLNERIRLSDLAAWFRDEAIAAVNRGGRFRPGYEIVRYAVLRCIPGADGMWYDGDRKEIALSISGKAQPFGNLSAGQRMMLSLVADIAIKAVMQNNFLVPPDALTLQNTALPRVLAQTPGVVLIDELDVHLHPRWQRRVASDLKATFPEIQFLCTSHSPQVIGEVQPEEIRLLDDLQAGQNPPHSFGLDSNAVLEEVMGAESRSRSSQEAIDAVEDALDIGDLALARSRLRRLYEIQCGTTRDSARLEATIHNLEALANAGD